MSDSDGKIVSLRKAKPCTICGKPADPARRPFCSKRCADLDLGKWLGEGYRIPSTEQPVDAAADPSREEEDKY